MIRRALVLAAVIVGLVLSAPAAYAQYQPGQPGLALIPSTAAPGAAVQVEGFGCARNSTVVLAIDGTEVGTTVAGDNSEGSYSATITAPATAGAYTVSATCGEITVSATLTVQDQPDVPTDGSLPVTGSGSTTTLVRAGLALLAVGGFVVIAVRRRTSRV